MEFKCVLKTKLDLNCFFGSLSISFMYLVCQHAYPGLPMGSSPETINANPAKLPPKSSPSPIKMMTHLQFQSDFFCSRHVHLAILVSSRQFNWCSKCLKMTIAYVTIDIPWHVLYQAQFQLCHLSMNILKSSSISHLNAS